MKVNVPISFPLLLAVLALCIPVFAHHGSAPSYDATKPVTLTGTVTEWVWSNPHCQLYFDVKDEKGTVVHWAAETNSPGALQRAGWSKKIFNAGDTITITVFPSKVGAPVGLISKIVLPDGRVLTRRDQETAQ